MKYSTLSGKEKLGSQETTFQSDGWQFFALLILQALLHSFRFCLISRYRQSNHRLELAISTLVPAGLSLGAWRMNFKQSYLQKLSWSCSVIATLFQEFCCLIWRTADFGSLYIRHNW
jgi:hypothetical protein